MAIRLSSHRSSKYAGKPSTKLIPPISSFVRYKSNPKEANPPQTVSTKAASPPINTRTSTRDLRDFIVNGMSSLPEP